MKQIGENIKRQESYEKVTGKAKYTADYQTVGALVATVVTSAYAHADILAIDIKEAQNMPGVRKVITGEGLPLTGEQIRDRPILAYERVRFYGEAVVLIVADTLANSKAAAKKVKITYKPLPVINSPTEAFQENATIIHPRFKEYQSTGKSIPRDGTNIVNETKIRKGDVQTGISESEVMVEASFSFPPSDHAAMETRACLAEIRENGEIIITSSSQAPFMIKRYISEYFHIDAGKVIVHTPLVGGGYGGKASIQLELLAYVASREVDGRLVRIVNSREEDMLTSPCHIGLDSKIKLYATKEGRLTATEITYLFDGGAYSDKATDVSRAGASDCTGPYKIDHIYCDAYCMYTNHPYAAPYRGFGHGEVLFAFERMMDILADKLQMDPLYIREINSILPGDTAPTQTVLTRSNLGNLPACITKLKQLMDWNQQKIIEENETFIKARGVACFWKNSTIESTASSGVILVMNSNGSLNVMSGVVEIGTGTKTILAQMLAEYLQMDVNKIRVKMEIDTQTTPEHWKTVASRGTLMAGRALLRAADDIVKQLKELASTILHVKPENLIVANQKVYVKDNPAVFLHWSQLAMGYAYPNGNGIGGQIIGRGTYMLQNLTHMEAKTGKGNLGPEWAVGAIGVDILFHKRDFTYTVTNVYIVSDVGKVLNKKALDGQLMGALAMGLTWACREGFVFDPEGKVVNPQFRTYRPLRYGEEPVYQMEYVETPHTEAPYGARGAGELGTIGIAPAIANALSKASSVPINELPILPELIWQLKQKEGRELD